MKFFALTAALAVVPFAATASDWWDEAIAGSADWDTATRIMQQAERAPAAASTGVFRNAGFRLYLAPDGRLVADAGDAADAAMHLLALGSHSREGNWLTVTYDGHAIDPSSIDHAAIAVQREEFARAAAEYEAAAAAELAEDTSIDEGAGLESEALAEVDVEFDDAEEFDVEAFDEEASEAYAQRLLIVPYRGGSLLIDENMLSSLASGWDGEGPLRLYASFWKLPGLPAKAVAESADGEDSGQTGSFAIEQPLSAGLPWELRRMLLKDVVQVTAVERLVGDDELVWSRQSAQVELRVDGGEHLGLFKGMSLFGLPPDEALLGEVVSVQPDSAVVAIEIERFSPRDQLETPQAGIRFVNRRDTTIGCGIDPTPPISATVVSADTDALEYDDEGFGFFELTIDQGSAQGLMKGDELAPSEYYFGMGSDEGDEQETTGFEGEGRVIETSSNSATLLWRVQRYGDFHEVRLPKAGSEVANNAWRRAKWELENP